MLTASPGNAGGHSPRMLPGGPGKRQSQVPPHARGSVLSTQGLAGIRDGDCPAQDASAGEAAKQLRVISGSRAPGHLYHPGPVFTSETSQPTADILIGSAEQPVAVTVTPGRNEPRLLGGRLRPSRLHFNRWPSPKRGGVAAPGRGVLCRRSWRRGRPLRRPPSAHLHMISWVSSTRHISGFLSWPS